MPRAYTEARKQSNKRWDDAHIEHASVIFPKGTKDRLKACADSLGVSVNKFINLAVSEKIENMQKEEQQG